MYRRSMPNVTHRGDPKPFERRPSRCSTKQGFYITVAELKNDLLLARSSKLMSPDHNGNQTFDFVIINRQTHKVVSRLFSWKTTSLMLPNNICVKKDEGLPFCYSVLMTLPNFYYKLTPHGQFLIVRGPTQERNQQPRTMVIDLHTSQIQVNIPTQERNQQPRTMVIDLHTSQIQVNNHGHRPAYVTNTGK